MQFDRYHVGWAPSRMYLRVYVSMYVRMYFVRRHLRYRLKHSRYTFAVYIGQNLTSNFIISIFTSGMRTYKKEKKMLKLVQSYERVLEK